MTARTASLGSVVVTGVSSFIGCHLALRFAAEGYQVIGTHRAPLATYDGIRKARLDALPPNISMAQLDICDENQIADIVDRSRPSLWIQHAGYAAGYGSLDFDLSAGFDVNVIPLSKLYRRLQGSAAGVVVTGSSTEYSDSDDASQEDDPCVPSMPYGLCKLAETLAASQLSGRYGIPTRVARVYIPFGRLDNPAKLLAQVVVNLRSGRHVDLSPCTQRRDFIGVSALADGYLALAGDLARGGFDIFNLCSGTATLLRDFVTSIADRLGADRNLLRFGAVPMRPGEPDVSYGSNEKAKRRLGWVPPSVDECIETDLL